MEITSEQSAITFEQLPRAVSQIREDISLIKHLLLERSHSEPIADQWLDLAELCDYLPDKPAKSTLYNYVSTNTIPYHKGGKKLRFLRSEIDKWLREGMPEVSEADRFKNYQKIDAREVATNG